MKTVRIITGAIALAGSAMTAPQANAQMQVTGTQDTGTQVTGTLSDWEKPAVETMISRFTTWIADNSDYEISEDPIRQVVFVKSGALVGSGERQVTVGNRTRGYFDEATGTIYIVRPWFPADPYDQSVLLHEMVHHAQVGARHWYCPQAQEWDAYKLQEAWLGQRGLKSNFHWAAILLESSCAVRDHHPD